MVEKQAKSSSCFQKRILDKNINQVVQQVHGNQGKSLLLHIVYLLLYLVHSGLGGSDTGLVIFFSSFFFFSFFNEKYIILILLKVCKECKNTLKQVEGSNRYYCDSSPTICSRSLKIHNIQYVFCIVSRDQLSGYVYDIHTRTLTYANA